MGDILFLAHRMPFPPDRGDKIRSCNLLRYLAELAPVHVGCFSENAQDRAAEPMLVDVGASYCMTERTKPLPIAGLEALATHKPVSLTAFSNAAMSDWVARTIATRQIETIFVFSGQMGQYVPGDFKGRVVVDLCDVDSAKFDAYGQSGSGFRRWIDRREGRLLSRIEARLANRASTTLLVSEAEAELFRARIGSTDQSEVRVIRNGIDTGLFSPAATSPHPQLPKAQAPHLVFTGQMDYAPNVEAAKLIIETILPQIRRIHSGAKFHVVGRAPHRSLLPCDGRDGVRIWGEVPDVRPFLASADIVLAPLQIARGIQNKVLEAMAMARPIVLSPEAATGIDAQDGIHFAVGEGTGELAKAILSLLADTPRATAMGEAARRYVSEKQSWPAMLMPLAEIAGFPATPLQHDDAA